MADGHDLQVLIILVLIPLAIAGMSSVLDGIDAASSFAVARPMFGILPDLLHFIGSRPLVGYWIDFDVSMLDKYLLAMINTRLPNRRIDVSKLYYDRKFGSAPPGTRIDLRYTTILADLKLPQRGQHDAFEDALGAAEAYLILKDMRERGVRLPRERPPAAGGIPLA